MSFLLPQRSPCPSRLPMDASFSWIFFFFLLKSTPSQTLPLPSSRGLPPDLSVSFSKAPFYCRGASVFAGFFPSGFSSLSTMNVSSSLSGIVALIPPFPVSDWACVACVLGFLCLYVPTFRLFCTKPCPQSASRTSPPF